MSVTVGKKLINDPSNTVNESLEGFTILNPHVALIKEHKIVIRKDVEVLKKEGKVCLISGGGSGHEPAHAGYVGQGMLTAAVCGDVFASPTSSAVLTAIRACASSAGVLLIIKNYTGDRLHFGKAAERAKAEGIRTEMIVVGEDCALTSKDKSAGRRGLCGTVLVHKIAGAMAEYGKSLDDILQLTSNAVVNMGTISISLSPCSVPGQTATFSIPSDCIEFGLGIHGEPGVKQIKLASAKEVVKEMIDHLLNSDYMQNLERKHIVVIVNNLGGTSNLEMNIMAGEVFKYLRSLGFLVERLFVGAFMTSLEMAGVSVTVLASSKEIISYLDKESEASGWCSNGKLPNPDEVFADNETDVNVCNEASKVETQSGKLLYKCLLNVCTQLIENENKLNELDRAAGDGDCGTTLSRGAKAIQERLGTPELSSFPFDDPAKLVLSLATLLEDSMGGTSGAIFSLFLTSTANALKEKEGQVAVVQAVSDGIDAVKKYGAAEEGDRTMLDALCPAFRALSDNANSNTENSLKAAAKAAMDGAKSTASMSAKAGRSSYIASSNLTAPDPGAMAVAFIFGAIAITF